MARLDGYGRCSCSATAATMRKAAEIVLG